jgi:hypothetical protein
MPMPKRKPSKAGAVHEPGGAHASRQTPEWFSKVVFLALGALATITVNQLSERRERQAIAKLLLTEVEQNARTSDDCFENAEKDTSLLTCEQERTVFNATLARQGVLPIDSLRLIRDTYEQNRTVVRDAYARELFAQDAGWFTDPCAAAQRPSLQIFTDARIKAKASWTKLNETLEAESQRRWWLNWF